MPCEGVGDEVVLHARHSAPGTGSPSGGVWIGPRTASGADSDELVLVLAQPPLRGRAVVLRRMEVAPAVVFPGAVGLPDQAALAEQVRGGALAGAPAPQRAV